MSSVAPAGLTCMTDLEPTRTTNLDRYGPAWIDGDLSFTRSPGATRWRFER